MFTGRWRNERGSEMELQQDGEKITGVYVTRVGDERVVENEYPLTGFAYDELIAFVVSWPPAKSMTAWVGRRIQDDAGIWRIHTVWHLVREVVAGDPPRPAQPWESFLTYSSTFVQVPEATRQARKGRRGTLRVAVVGAGPGGLAAAKALIECDIEPVILEGADELGGVWRPGSGLVWPEMRTNLSKWTCAFSDYPWPEEAEDFPLADAVHGYLNGYASEFGLLDRLRFGTRVTDVSRIEGGWRVEAQGDRPRDFDGVVIASGVFSKPYVPPIEGLGTFGGRVSHSSRYREAGSSGRRVAVVGASLSGIEIASHLALHGVQVVLLASRLPWILPRYVDGAHGRPIPLDLTLYHRRSAENALMSAPESTATVNSRSAAFLEQRFGNPGTVHPSLTPPAAGTPTMVAISDDFLRFVQEGKISVAAGRLLEMTATAVQDDSGQQYSVDEVIFCTGYECDLSFLAENVRTLLEYDATDKLVAFVGAQAVTRPETPGLCFVGVYKGPYFGIMELQARWSALLLSGQLRAPSAGEMTRMLDQERGIRKQMPRPQFPHSDYVGFADDIAVLIGALPTAIDDPELQQMLEEGPVTPSQYRLVGPYASPAIARGAIGSANARVAK